MKKHLTYNELANFIAEVYDAVKNADIKNHLQSCDTCARAHERMLSFQRPYYRQKVRISDNVRIRILESYDTIRNREAESGPSLSFLRRVITPPRIVAAGIAMLAIIISALVINTYFFADPAKPMLFTISEHYGNVTVNGAPIGTGDRIGPETSIETSAASYVILSFEKTITVKILSNSRLQIDKSMLSGKAKDVELKFYLARGSLISNITHESTDYLYRTPLAVIDSRGTRFLVHASGEKTTVYMEEGSVTIKSSLSEAETITSGKNKYTVSETITSKPLTDSEKVVYQALRRMNNKEMKIEAMDRVLNSFQRDESPPIDALTILIQDARIGKENMDTSEKEVKKKEAESILPDTSDQEIEPATEQEKEVDYSPSEDEADASKKREIRDNMKELQELRRSRRGIRSR